MTPDERKILEEAEQQAFDTSQAFYDVPTSGIRTPPSIDETETTLDPQLFGFDFGQQPETEVAPESTSEGGEPVCSPCLQITFHDVLFDCGCLPRSGIVWSNFTDVGLFNDSPVTVYSDPGIIPGCEDCLYFWQAGSTQLFNQTYSDPGCSSLITEDTVEFAGNISMWRDLTGLWHLRHMYIASDPLFFYGTSPSLSSAFNNLVSCSSSDTWPNFDCTGSFPSAVAGHGGYATVEIVACP